MRPALLPGPFAGPRAGRSRAPRRGRDRGPGGYCALRTKILPTYDGEDLICAYFLAAGAVALPAAGAAALPSAGVLALPVAGAAVLPSAALASLPAGAAAGAAGKGRFESEGRTNDGL